MQFATTQDLRAYLMPLIEEWDVSSKDPDDVNDEEAIENICDEQEDLALRLGLSAAPYLVKLLQEEWAAQSEYRGDLSLFCISYLNVFGIEFDSGVELSSIENKDLRILLTMINELCVFIQQDKVA
jgi:hypothetical protein